MIAEPINTALRIAGIPLTFLSFTINALPRFEVFVQQSDVKAYYEINPQEFVFDTSTSLVAAHSIALEDEFTMSDGTYIYTFVITDIVPDLTGWSALSATYRFKTAV